MATLRERIEAETHNSKSDPAAWWLDEELGDFILSLTTCDEMYCRSEALLKKFPTDEELEAAYARWLVERGE